MELQIYPVIGAILNQFLIPWIRKSPWFAWVNEESKGQALALAAALSALWAVLSMVLFGHQVDASALQTLGQALSQLAVTFSFSVGMHETSKRLSE